jgi:hypothetical protein
MAGRPPTYQSKDEKPVSVSVRIPRALYGQLQQRANQRRLTMTETLLEGAQLWLDTPADPREGVLSDNGNTVIQAWEDRVAEMIEVRVQAALATLQAPPAEGRILPTEERHPANAPFLSDNGNTAIQERAPVEQRHPASAAMPYDNGTTVLQGGAPAMKQCGKGHDPYPASKLECPQCVRERKRAYRKRQAEKRRGEIPA